MLISMICPFLIFLDFHKARNIHKSVLFIVAFFVIMFLLGFAADALKFKLIYLVIIIPSLLFGILFLKNNKKDEVDF